MRTSIIAALAAFCAVAVLLAPVVQATDSETTQPVGYYDQLDANGQSVYQEVATSIQDAQAEPKNSMLFTIRLYEPVLFTSTEDARTYALDMINSALAAVYYTDPMAVWLWDLPVTAVEVIVSTTTVQVGDVGYFMADWVEFTLNVPVDMEDDSSTEEVNELLNRMDELRSVVQGITVSGSVAEKVRAIADNLLAVSDTDDEEGQVSNIYDALVTRSSSSAGIAAAFTQLCQQNGVTALTVKGTVYESFGADAGAIGYWNVVQDGENWYGADATWYTSEDRSPLLAGYTTETSAVAGGERFGSTHMADLDLSSTNTLVPIQISADGYAWPDESTFFDRYGTHVFAVVIVIVIAGTLLYAIRKGNV